MTQRWSSPQLIAVVMIGLLTARTDSAALFTNLATGRSFSTNSQYNDPSCQVTDIYYNSPWRDGWMSCWCAASSSATCGGAYAQVDLKTKFTINQVGVLGCQWAQGHDDEWITKYKIEYINSAGSWVWYGGGTGTVFTYSALEDNQNEIRRTFSTPFEARYVRIYPTDSVNWCCTDWELYGVLPTPAPTSPPTQRPTAPPTKRPTDNPTQRPTDNPTQRPTDNPTQRPTDNPTQRPTDNPTKGPTDSPTKTPTDGPTPSPIEAPTPSPSAAPTEQPTENPTVTPTNNPSASPIVRTVSPTGSPTGSPTVRPTGAPVATLVVDDDDQGEDEGDQGEDGQVVEAEGGAITVPEGAILPYSLVLACWKW